MDMEARYQERLNRYVTALRNGKPDRIPIRPFVAEFTARYAGFTCQDVAHDYEKAFVAARRCAADFDWDAVVANMVYVWTGLAHAIGLRYYGVPGVDIPADTGFQYLEPQESDAFMRADEYDALIADPTGFLYETWLPRVARDVQRSGEPVTFRHNMSILKGGMAMMTYFNAFGPQIEALRRESGTVSAIAGIFKAPFDIIADKLRGYIGLTMDLMTQPDKVLAACEALMPHLYQVALGGADPEKNVPIGFWMHRGCVPFITPDQFDNLYWPTLRPIIEALWAQGHQTMFYAEGKWDAHLEAFAALPDQSIVFHIDRTDYRRAHDVLGHKFCLSGGVPNFLLAYGTPDEVRAYCKDLIDYAGRDGGYIMDASAIMQNDSKAENVRAMTEFTREYGVYNGAASPTALSDAPGNVEVDPESWRKTRRAPGVCVPWEEKLAELPPITGDADLVRRIWENVDALGYLYIWQCLLSF